MDRAAISLVQIRLYEPSDIDNLISLFRESVRRVARRDYTEEQVKAWAPDDIDREARAVRHPSRPTWIAEIDGKMVGFSDLERDGHLDCMYVHADYQGRGIETNRIAVRRLWAAASLGTCPGEPGHQMLFDIVKAILGAEVGAGTHLACGNWGGGGPQR